MKSKRLTKIYQSMTSEDIAVLTFDALVYGDNFSAKEMAFSVPRFDYRCADKNYTERLNRIFAVAALWSIEYWKCYAKMLASMGLDTQNKKESNQSKSLSVSDLELIWEGRLCALGQILLCLKDSHNINIKTMAKFSDVENIYGLDITPDMLLDDAKEYYKNYLAYFEAQIDGVDVSESVAEYLGWCG